MIRTRRHFLATAACTAGGITLLPFAAQAAGTAGDVFATDTSHISVHPISHASFVMQTPVGTIYCDPVGDPGAYAAFPPPDLILITHEHGDHFKVDTLAALASDATRIIANPATYAMLPANLQKNAEQIANGQKTSFASATIGAIPAYNTTKERQKFHPKGRDNGYVLEIDGFRIYISGDTEDIPEMRGLRDIDLAFVCMNLPFTMDAQAAASAVSEFKPSYVYPYHYRGREGGTQDPKEFAGMLTEATKIKFGDWYG